MWNTFKILSRHYKSTIYSTMENKLVLPWSRGKIEKSFSPKLTDYFIQGVRKWCPELIPDIKKNSTGCHFQNGRHNAAKIQHCTISLKFDMWVDNDVPNWFSTLSNFYRSQFSKWPPQYRKNSTLFDIITIWYVGR